MAEQKLASLHETLGDKAWLQFWQDNNIPWDTGVAAPPLMQLVVTTDLVPKAGIFLIPGCGSCHEGFALLADSPQRKIIGLDMSPIAMERNREKRQKLGLSPAQIEFYAADFFDEKSSEMEGLNGGGFDVVFDYTFLCALRPARRQDWAQRMAQLIKPGTGLLITLMFPLSKHEGGPPFALSEEM